MLDRYKKSGGFQQLLSLIETFGPQKQGKFISLIEEENPRWAELLKEKLISIDRIFSWPTEVLAEVVPRMTPKNLAIALSGVSPEQVARLYSGLPNSEKRKIELEAEGLQPTPNEVAATHVKLIEAVRQMIAEGDLRVEKFDATLQLDSKIEDRLLQSSITLGAEPRAKAQGAAPVASAPAEEPTETKVDTRTDFKLAAEIKAMQTLILSLQKENKTLKSETKILRDKLDQIRKIA